jgi:putative membrane protein
MTQATRPDDWHHLHPLSPFIRTAHFVAAGVVVAAQQVSTIFETPLLSLAVFAIGVVIAALYGYVSYRWTGFRVSTEQIELKTGVLFRQHRRIPIDRIEAIDIARPLTARIFGLVELRTEVVSGGTSEMRFQFLDHDDATALREFVLQVRNTASHGSETLAIDAEPERVALEVSAQRILIAYSAPQALFVLTLGFVLAVSAATANANLALGVLISVLPIMLGIFLTTIKVIENFWGFRVSYDDHGIVVRRGLLNELTQKVPAARIQGLRIEEPFFWRRFGFARLVVDVAGYRNTKVDGAAETAVLAPVATKHEIRTLLTDLIGSLDIDALETVQVSARARFRSPVSYRFLSIAGDDKWAVSRHGVIRRRTDVVAHGKAQSIRVTQGPWQRKLELATLHIDTAGSRIHFRAPHRTFEEANELAWASRRLSDT